MRLHALGTALPNQQQADALQQLDWRVHPFGQENVGLAVTIVDFDFARQKNSRSLGREALDLFDQPGSIQTGHNQIGQDQVDAALFEALQSLGASRAGEHAIASGFQHDLTNRERLFVIVDAEDRSFWFHSCFRDGEPAEP